MNTDTLRFLDRYVGIPLCWIFTVARRLAGTGRRSRSLPPPRKVLVIKLSEMGSTVLAYPALAELKQRCPDVELFFLVFKNNVAIIHALNLTGSANIITVDIDSTSRLGISGLGAIRRLLRERIDTTIDMDFFSRFTMLFSFLICRGNRVGFHRYTTEGLYRGNLLTHRVMYSSHVHTSVAFMALTRTLFETPEDEPHYRGAINPKEVIYPKYFPPAEDVESVKRKLEAAGMVGNDKSTVILVNPNSSEIFPLRKWPLSDFTELCERLMTALPRCFVVITGVASEGADADYILNHVQDRRCINFTGKTTFRELLALYSLATLMVTNDSGPAHFASLTGLFTIVLFGPETPQLYSPLGEQHKNFYSAFACSPCVSVYNAKKSPCQENRCLKSITVDGVLSEILAHVSSRSARSHGSSQESHPDQEVGD